MTHLGTQEHRATSRIVACRAAGRRKQHKQRALSQHSVQRLRREGWQLLWSKEDGVSTVLPFEGAINRGDAGNSSAIRVHLYGPQVGELDGRDYTLPTITSATGVDG